MYQNSQYDETMRYTQSKCPNGINEKFRKVNKKGVRRCSREVSTADAAA